MKKDFFKNWSTEKKEKSEKGEKKKNDKEITTL